MGRIEGVRAAVRRFQLVVGIGFVSCAAGLLLSLAVGTRLRNVVPNLHPLAVAQVAAMAIRQLWEYAVLPLACYGAARILPLSPWKTAVGAVATGELFLVALDFFTGMTGAWFHEPLLGALRLVSMGGGVGLSGLAILRARASAGRAEEVALAAAERRKSEYDAFVQEAERVASLRDGAAGGPERVPPRGTGIDPD